MREVKTMVLRAEGTNCDEETVIAFERAGSSVDLVHINELRRGRPLEEYQILCIPGGFTYGDDIAAGKILAIRLKNEIGNQIKDFVEEGKLIFGICNGFQVLVKVGLLPALEGTMRKQEATLAFNDSGHFVDRWVYLKREAKGACVFTKGVKDITFMPVNHGEGKFVADQKTIERLKENNQIIFRYVDSEGKCAGYPWNPNGSLDNIAGICNPEGNILGLMPHPEKYIQRCMHPHWTRLPGLGEEGDGFSLFKGAVNYASKKF
jgi:phosphoribosylformylglycinamidine synthase